MTRQAHDQFAKQYLAELLSALGEVETSRDVTSEVRQVDLYFVPATSPKVDPENYGILGKIATSTCLIEPFRNPPTPIEVRNCLLKLFIIQEEMLGKAKREKNSLKEADLPCLWILSPSVSPRLTEGFGAKLNPKKQWSEGIHFFPEFYKTGIVAINQLPINPFTLWLRLLGRGATQQQAVNELVSLPENNAFKGEILELLANWRINVQVNQNLTNDDQELIMNLSPAYLRWREDTLLEGRRELVSNLLKVRFGSIDEALAKIIEPMLQLSPEELTPLLLNSSCEELLARFGGELN